MTNLHGCCTCTLHDRSITHCRHAHGTLLTAKTFSFPLQSDYCIGIDREWALDGRDRAVDTKHFSACHINHSRSRCNVARRTLRKRQAVQIFAVRDIQCVTSNWQHSCLHLNPIIYTHKLLSKTQAHSLA